MRARGSKVTDIVVLVVAADDGVMPQTLEAIDHAKAANVPIIVAVNKIDKPDAMPERVKKQLADRGLMPEDWGGSTVFVDVSAKQKTNLNLLMEMICLVADLQDLKAAARSAGAPAPCWKPSWTADAVRWRPCWCRTVRCTTGDNFVVGNVFGKVRAMFNDRGAAWKRRLRRLRSRFLDWKDCRRRAISWLRWPIARKRAASPSTAKARRAKRSWPRVRACRSKVWRSS